MHGRTKELWPNGAIETHLRTKRGLFKVKEPKKSFFFLIKVQAPNWDFNLNKISDKPFKKMDKIT